MNNVHTTAQPPPPSETQILTSLSINPGLPNVELASHELSSVMQAQDAPTHVMNGTPHSSVNGFHSSYLNALPTDPSANVAAMNMNELGNASHVASGNFNTLNDFNNINNIHNLNDMTSSSPHLQLRPVSASGAHFPPNSSVNYVQNSTQSSMNYMNANNTTGHNDASRSSIDTSENKLNFGSNSNMNTAFQNPFYVNSYPITNPPLFDSTTLLPIGDGSGSIRGRRISISNGQIGQIVNHQAFFMDEDLTEELCEQSHQLGPQSLQTSAMQVQDESRASRNRAALPRSSDLGYSNINEQAQLVSSPSMNGIKSEFSGSLDGSLVTSISHEGMNARVDSGNSSTAHNGGVAGLPPPNYLLIYNNEVIFNPSNGPIPGTAAWRKERLLERNRVAASKCRQRKKHAQQQMQDNMNKVEKQLKEKEALIQEYKRLLGIYNSAVKCHLNGEDRALDSLREHFDNPFLDSSQESAVGSD